MQKVFSSKDYNNDGVLQRREFIDFLKVARP